MKRFGEKEIYIFRMTNTINTVSLLDYDSRLMSQTVCHFRVKTIIMTIYIYKPIENQTPPLQTVITVLLRPDSFGPYSSL